MVPSVSLNCLNTGAAFFSTRGNSSLIVLTVSHLSPDIAMPLNLLAADTAKSFELVFSKYKENILDV